LIIVDLIENYTVSSGLARFPSPRPAQVFQARPTRPLSLLGGAHPTIPLLPCSRVARPAPASAAPGRCRSSGPPPFHPPLSVEPPDPPSFSLSSAGHEAATRPPSSPLSLPPLGQCSVRTPLLEAAPRTSLSLSSVTLTPPLCLHAAPHLRCEPELGMLSRRCAVIHGARRRPRRRWTAGEPPLAAPRVKPCMCSRMSCHTGERPGHAGRVPC
jgi:hypothetical protein